MSGRKSQRKGSAHELETKKDFIQAGYPAVKTGMWAKDDITVTIKGLKLVVECKRRKRGFASLYKFLEQGNMVVHRDDRQEQLITMPLQLFFALRGGP